jgi:hypothetical protein
VGFSWGGATVLRSPGGNRQQIVRIYAYRATVAESLVNRKYRPNKRTRHSGHEAVSNSTHPQTMLWTIFVILLILWLIGLVSGTTLSGFIHILLVIAVVVLIINLIQGKRTL